MKNISTDNGILNRLSTLFAVLFIAAGLQACSEALPEPEIIELDPVEARLQNEQIRNDVPIILADGLQITLWASEELVKDPVALHMDDDGRAWVTMTNRSSSSEFDIRNWPQWTTETLKFNDVEDRREFLHTYFSTERSDENAERMPDRNEDGLHDWRDLTVEKEEIYRIEDRSGDGMADYSQLFARGFNDEISDVAASVLYHDGDLFVGVAPDMWRMRDTTGDGMGDSKESIAHGFGVHIGIWGHGLSGLKVGPDGRLYWSIGDPGYNITDQEGNHWNYPHQGSIFRSEPDGSNFEVFARGLRNTHEFSFDKYGNLITVDNDGDFPGEFERLLYVVNGADGGWRTHWQFGKYTDEKNNNYNVWSHESYYHPPFDEQAAHVLPSLGEYHNGPAGMAYNPGTALNERWKDYFFVVSFVGSPVRSAINAFTLEPSGASFELVTDEQALSGIAASGLSFGPDGALYLADWIEGWSQNQQGRIWKIDTEESDSAVRNEVRELLGTSFDDHAGEELVELMGHEDMRVRQKAQLELAGRNAADHLQAALRDDHQLRRVHGIWGIGQLGRNDIGEVQSLLTLLSDNDAEIRAQAARTLGDVRYEPAADQLIGLLSDSEERVRFFGTEALGRLAHRPALDPIVQMLEENDDNDLFLRQAGAIALGRIGDGDAVASLADHPSVPVRVAAVVALRNMEHPGLARFLVDENEYVATNAARAINDDTHIAEALPELSRVLEQTRSLNEALLRRAVNAALYNGTEEDAGRLARFAARPDVSDVMRVEALSALSVWPSPSDLDRVSGRYRGEFENSAELARNAIAPVIEDLVLNATTPIQVAAAEAIRGLDYRDGIPYLVATLEGAGDATVREASLVALRDLEYDRLDEVFALALDDDEIRQAALEMLAAIENIDEQSKAELLGTVLETGTTRERQIAFQTLGQVNHQAAWTILDTYLDDLMADDLAREVELDLIRAVETTGQENLTRRLNEYHAAKPADDPIAAFSESLYGGDEEQGRTIFYEHAAGQCMRCHVVDGSGSDVGPDLTDVGARFTRELLLQSLVDPTRRLAPGYGSVTITLEDGQSLQGVLEAETENSITIQSAGESREFALSDISERVNHPSGMPPMGQLLTRSELRDLVEFMTTLD